MSQGESVAAPPLAMGVRINLSIMMFLQFAIWGAWATNLVLYLGHLGFDGTTKGWILGTMALGSIFTPILIGAVADRYFASEKMMGLLHLAGAGLLYWMTQIHDAKMFFIASLIYALVYSPTLALANSVTFTHVPDGGRDFPSIRVFGTIGWIVAGVLVGYALPSLFDLKKGEVDSTNKPLLMAAAFSALLGLYSFFLPHTPPTGKAGDVLPALKAVGLLRDPSFAVFFGVSFIITIVLAFYYTFTGDYLGLSIFPRIDAANRPSSVAPIMLIGQISEMVILPFLPLFLYYFGMKSVLALGMLAWGVRYYLFALGDQGTIGPWVVIASLAFHGVCFDFFFAAGFIYVDKTAPPQVRASGQALFTFLTYGVGMWIGSVVSGYVVDHYTVWNQAGGMPVFQKSVDEYMKGVSSPTTKAQQADLLCDLYEASSGQKLEEHKRKGTQLAVQWRSQEDFAAFLTILEKNISDPKVAKSVRHFVEDARDMAIYKMKHAAWEKEIEKLKKAEKPESEWPKEPEKPNMPDFRDWYHIWLFPSIGVLVSLVIFLLFFHMRSGPPAQASPVTDKGEGDSPWSQPTPEISPTRPNEGIQKNE